jgi:hypothetical protein
LLLTLSVSDEGSNFVAFSKARFAWNTINFDNRTQRNAGSAAPARACHEK